MNRPVLLIRADASTSLGTGHVMRMLALAAGWRRRGGTVHLMGIDLAPALQQRLRDASVIVHSVSQTSVVGVGEARCTADGALTSEYARAIGATWIVADGYHFPLGFQRRVRRDGFRLAIVTDYDYCDTWSCDLVVNQNPHSVREAYASDLESCRRFLGTRYVMLRPEFLVLDAVHRDREAMEFDRGAKRILVTLGGSDAENVTGEILCHLEAYEASSLELRILVGAANPNRGQLTTFAEQSSHKVTVLTDVRDMPAQYEWVDGVISAGGSSCWEWMYFGLRAAIVAIADNQRPIYDDLVSRGIARGLRDTTESLKIEELYKFVDSIQSEEVQRDRYRSLIDGFGADRIAAAMDTPIWMRPAASSDCQLYFEWANDPVVRQNSLCSDAIVWTDHCRWFATQLGRTDAVLLVAIRDEVPVGQIRFTKLADGAWQISFSVAADARGGGVGGEIVRLGCAWMESLGHTTFTATAKVDNRASRRCFERLGWTATSDEANGLVHFRSG